MSSISTTISFSAFVSVFTSDFSCCLPAGCWLSLQICLSFFSLMLTFRVTQWNIFVSSCLDLTLQHTIHASVYICACNLSVHYIYNYLFIDENLYFVSQRSLHIKENMKRSLIEQINILFLRWRDRYHASLNILFSLAQRLVKGEVAWICPQQFCNLWRKPG